MRALSFQLTCRDEDRIRFRVLERLVSSLCFQLGEFKRGLKFKKVEIRPTPEAEQKTSPIMNKTLSPYHQILLSYSKH